MRIGGIDAHPGSGNNGLKMPCGIKVYDDKGNGQWA